MDLTLTQTAKKVLKHNSEEIKIAKDAFRNNIDTIGSELSEPVLEYLYDENHFNCLSQELKRNIDRLYDKPLKANVLYVDFLVGALGIDKLNGKKRKSQKKKVQEWVEKKHVDIQQRDDALRLCFALQLSPESANDFLFKGCQQQGLNIRSAKEAIVFFCLLQNAQNKKNYSFDDVEAILQEYKESCPTTTKEDVTSQNDISINSDTTMSLRSEIEQLADESMESKEKFMCFLKEKHNSFIGFSNNAYYRYFAIKLNLIGLLLQKEIEAIEKGEMPGVQKENSESYNLLLPKLCYFIDSLQTKELNFNLCDYIDLTQLKKMNTSLSTLKNCKNNGMNEAAQNKLFKRTQELLSSFFKNNINNNFRDFFREIRYQCLYNEKKRQHFFSYFPENGFWVYLLPGTFDPNHQEEFVAVTQKNFSKFRHVNTKSFPSQIRKETGADAIRKQIILMKCFELILEKKEEYYTESDYEKFIDRELEKCRFYPLYPRHYFDFLIMMTLRVRYENDSKKAIIFLRHFMSSLDLTDNGV